LYHLTASKPEARNPKLETIPIPKGAKASNKLGLDLSFKTVSNFDIRISSFVSVAPLRPFGFAQGMLCAG
jgi:hypothetical protein